jgi:methyltransferase-like protein
LSQAPFRLKVSDRPRTTPVIRWQARQGMKATNLRHERVELDPNSAALLPMLDGKHDHGELLASLMALHDRGRLQLPDKLLAATGAEEILNKQLDQALRFMAGRRFWRGDSFQWSAISRQRPSLK